MIWEDHTVRKTISLDKSSTNTATMWSAPGISVYDTYIHDNEHLFEFISFSAIMEEPEGDDAGFEDEYEDEVYESTVYVHNED